MKGLGKLSLICHFSFNLNAPREFTIQISKIYDDSYHLWPCILCWMSILYFVLMIIIFICVLYVQHVFYLWPCILCWMSILYFVLMITIFICVLYVQHVFYLNNVNSYVSIDFLDFFSDICLFVSFNFKDAYN